jgi:protein SCO1
VPSPRQCLLAVAALGVLLAGCGAGTPSAAPADAAAGLHGPSPDTPLSRPSFVLRDTGGAPYDFAAQTHGRPTYVYFGYTHCPDECPTAMADLASALARQPADLRDAARVVFVTTDPARDTGPVLRRWLDQFSASFVGLVGTPAELAAAQRAAGLDPAAKGGPQPTVAGHPDQHPREPATAPHSHAGPLGYAVTHADVILAYDASDRLPVVYPGGTAPQDIAADLPVLARPAARKETS